MSELLCKTAEHRTPGLLQKQSCRRLFLIRTIQSELADAAQLRELGKGWLGLGWGLEFRAGR